MIGLAAAWRSANGGLDGLLNRGFDSDGVTWLFIWIFFVAFSVGQCIWWRGTVFRTRYAIAGDHLVALRRGHVLDSIPVSQIAGVQIVGSMNWSTLLIAFRWSATWPAARIVLRDSHGSSEEVWFPDVMLWGSSSVAVAEIALRRVLGLSASGN